MQDVMHALESRRLLANGAFLPDAAPDTSQIPNFNDADVVAMDTSGRLYAWVKQVDVEGRSIARFTAEGNLDTTFAGDGLLPVAEQWTPVDALPIGLRVYQTDRILQYANDGTLDTTAYGGDGVLPLAFPLTLTPFQSGGFTTDAFATADGTTTRYADRSIGRTNADGSPVTSFGANGTVLLDPILTAALGQPITVGPGASLFPLDNGGVAVIGDTGLGSNEGEFYLLYLDANGDLNTTAPGNGLITGNRPNNIARQRFLRVLPDGTYEQRDTSSDDDYFTSFVRPDGTVIAGNADPYGENEREQRANGHLLPHGSLAVTGSVLRSFFEPTGLNYEFQQPFVTLDGPGPGTYSFDGDNTFWTDFQPDSFTGGFASNGNRIYANGVIIDLTAPATAPVTRRVEIESDGTVRRQGEVVATAPGATILAETNFVEVQAGAPSFNFNITVADNNADAFYQLGAGSSTIAAQDAFRVRGIFSGTVNYTGPTVGRYSTPSRLTGGTGTFTFGPGFNELTTDQRATVAGGSGDDRITVGSDSSVTGGSGNDRITAGPRSSLFGNDGDDTLSADGADVLLEGFDGNDTLIHTGVGYAILRGQAGDDTLLGSDDPAGREDFSGGSGNDTVDFGRPDSPLPIAVTRDNLANDGTDGENDNVRDDIETVLNADLVDGVRNVTVTTNFNTTTITATRFADTVRLIDAATLDVDGQRFTFPTDGILEIDLGPGDDLYRDLTALSRTTSVLGGLGNDTLRGGNSFDFLDGGAGDDLISDTNTRTDQAVNNVLFGGPGNDTLSSSGGDRLTINADETADGAGYDIVTVRATAGIVTIADVAGGLRVDFVGNGRVDIAGGSGNDSISAIGSGAHAINGNAGSDNIDSFGSSGATVLGGDGEDGLRVRPAPGGKHSVKLGRGADELQWTGAAGNLATILGDYGDDLITAVGLGNLLISGGNENDTITAGDGNDLIDGGQGDDYLFGGAGNDELFGSDGRDTISGGAGRNTLYGGTGDDRLNGSGGRDLLLGEGGDDRLYGNGGNDTLDGGGNIDRLFGGTGDDELRGGNQNDKLYGQAGNDTLIGGRGRDLMNGGEGDDTAYLDDEDDLALITHIETRL